MLLLATRSLLRRSQAERRAQLLTCSRHIAAPRVGGASARRRSLGCPPNSRHCHRGRGARLDLAAPSFKSYWSSICMNMLNRKAGSIWRLFIRRHAFAYRSAIGATRDVSQFTPPQLVCGLSQLPCQTQRKSDFPTKRMPLHVVVKPNRGFSSASTATKSAKSPAATSSGKVTSTRKKRPLRPPIPRESTMIPSRWQNIKSKIRHLRDFLSLYWQSVKLFAAEVKLAYRLAYNIYLKGHRYSRAERRAMQKAAVDIIKVLPLASMTMVVGTEITALLAARAIPNMLPRAFKPVAEKVDENLPKFVDKVLPSGKDRRKADADTKFEVAENLHALSLEHVSRLEKQVKRKAVRPLSGSRQNPEKNGNNSASDAVLTTRSFKHNENMAEYVAKDARIISDFLTRMDDHEVRMNAKDIAAVGPAFRRHMQLQQLSRMQLIRMNQYMNQGSELMNLVLPTFVLVRRLRHAISSARKDDKDIHFEGVSTLSLDELRDACVERGLHRTTDLPSELALRNRLRNWISLSINRDVPSSLLILSSALISRSQLRLEKEYGSSALQAETLRARISELDQLILKRTQQREELQKKLDLLLEAKNDVEVATMAAYTRQKSDKRDANDVLKELEDLSDVTEEITTIGNDMKMSDSAKGRYPQSESNVVGVLDHFTDYEPEDILLVRSVFEKYKMSIEEIQSNFNGDNSLSWESSEAMLKDVMLESMDVIAGKNVYEDGLCEEIVESYMKRRAENRVSMASHENETGGIHSQANQPEDNTLSWAAFLSDVSDLHRSVDLVQSQEYSSAKRLRESRELLESRTAALAQIESILENNPEEVTETKLSHIGGKKRKRAPL